MVIHNNLKGKLEDWKKLEQKYGKWKVRLYVPFVFPFILLLELLGKTFVKLGENLENFVYWLNRKV